MAARQDYQITAWCQRLMKEHVKEGSFCIDATMGNGNDTEFLCHLAGPGGQVLAFDIQEAALAHTQDRLHQAFPAECSLSSFDNNSDVCAAVSDLGAQHIRYQHYNYRLCLDSHANLQAYAKPDTADCIVFNLGYLPGGDHSIATAAQTTISALEQSLQILKKDGLLSICIYSGKDSGFDERDAVLEWLKNLDPRKYLVLLTSYFNRPNNPPIPVAVIKL